MKNKSNKKLGMKWYKFFTKIRPWLGVALGGLFALSTTVQLVDYLEYVSFDSLAFISIIQILCCIASLIMSLILAVKANDYEDARLSGEAFFKYIKVLLIFEISNIEFNWIVNKYYEGTETDLLIITSIVCLLMEYFIWYRPNIKYFKRRLLKNMITDITPNENELSYRLADASYKTKEYGNHIYAKDIMLQTDGISAKISTNEPEIPTQSQPQTIRRETSSGKIKYCSRCGSKINSETKKCVGCGKQYFRGLKGNKTLTILLIIMLVFSAFLNVYLFTKIGETSTLKREITALKSDKDTLNDTITRLRNQIKQSDAELSVCYQEIEFIDEFVVFVEDNGTNYYHKYQCSEFIGDGFWAFNVEAARGEGYRPCPLCQ